MDEPKRRRTEITIETRSITIIKLRGGKTESVFCKNCERNVRIFSLAQAVLIFRVGAEFLEALSRSNQIHPVGEDALCGDSLADFFKQKIRFGEE